MTSSVDPTLDAFVHALETLTPESLPALDRLLATDIYFRDPFNEVRGAAAYRHVYSDMFEKASDVRFRVNDSGCSGRTGFLGWEFACRPRSRFAGLLAFSGMSTIRWNEAGLITEHVDYWDAGANVYERLPVVGSVIRFVKKRFAA